MATPAEKKALLFLGTLILLGGSVRLWRANKNVPQHTSASVSGTPSAHKPKSGASRPKSPTGSTRSNIQTSNTSSALSTSTPPKAKRAKRPPKPNPDDLTQPIDLDAISLADLTASGVVKAAIARMIIANRDSFGPFGSLVELERIPYLRKTTITTLAPYVTFSRVPRPSNTVMHPRSNAREAPDTKVRRPTRRSP